MKFNKIKGEESYQAHTPGTDYKIQYINPYGYVLRITTEDMYYHSGNDSGAYYSSVSIAAEVAEAAERGEHNWKADVRAREEREARTKREIENMCERRKDAFILQLRRLGLMTSEFIELIKAFEELDPWAASKVYQSYTNEGDKCHRVKRILKMEKVAHKDGGEFSISAEELRLLAIYMNATDYALTIDLLTGETYRLDYSDSVPGHDGGKLKAERYSIGAAVREAIDMNEEFIRDEESREERKEESKKLNQEHDMLTALLARWEQREKEGELHHGEHA